MVTYLSAPVWLLFLLSVCIHLSLSCMCDPEAPQDLMCSTSKQATIILKGKPSDAIMLKQGITKYKLKVLNVFKGKSLLTSVDKEWLFISKKLGSCPHAYLLTGNRDVYLIAAYVKRGQLWLGNCPHYYQWSQMTRKVKNGFRGNYLDYCDCKTSDCANGPYRWSCYVNYSYCAVSNNTSVCEWKSNPALTACLHTAYGYPEE